MPEHDFAVASSVELDKAANARAAMDRQLNILTPEQDKAILREAGFSNLSLFYAAFTWRGCSIPAETQCLDTGFYFNGKGKLWIDMESLRYEIIDDEAATTPK